jgi:predicted branched-subunit amino acid permease
MVRTELRAGAMAIVPMLIGVIPFGLVAGVTPVAGGLGGGAAVGFSTIVFAGASQLAAIEVLSDGGAAVVAALAACTINLRMLLYSASLAPYLSSERFGRRMAVAYLLTDQAYAVSILRWRGERGPATASADPAAGADPTATADTELDSTGSRTGDGGAFDRSLLDRRWSFYLGAGLTLWGAWQASTVAGVLLGNAIPDSVPLGFAVPLVFLVLLIPTLDRAHAVVAAAVGGLATVVALELGVGPLSVMVGAVAGVLAGALADRDDRAEPVAAS